MFHESFKISIEVVYANNLTYLKEKKSRYFISSDNGGHTVNL